MRSLVLSSLFLVATTAPACTVVIKYEVGSLKWNATPGAVEYRVQESADSGVTSRNYIVKGYEFRPTRRLTSDTRMTYIVTAMLESGVRAADLESDGCSSRINVTIPADPAFRKLTRKAILPIVVSTAGANGSRFKTSLALRAIGDARGRIIFHPANAIANANDPSLPYDMHNGDRLFFEDIVATLGQSGLGSIELLPDEDAESVVPLAEVRLFNDTPDGTFGSFAPVAYPFDFLRPQPLTIVAPDPRFRVNVGFRALTDVRISVLIFGADGRLQSFFDRSYFAGWMQMTSVAAFIGRDLAAGESFQVFFDGSAIPFYTLTENRTNDPTVIIATPGSTSTNVGAYID